MKKGLVVVLVLLAAVILVSPAIVGRMAERSMDENLNWAAQESGAVRVTSESFERGWFSSEGQHRIEITDGELLSAMTTMGMQTDEVPVLLINTKLDHGLIPVSSMGREQGSLAPGLGSAVSTLAIESPDGEVVELPGKIYSKVGLGGELQSNYVVGPGSHTDGDTTASWGSTDIDVKTDPSSGEAVYRGKIGDLSIDSGNEGVSLGGISFEGEQMPTDYGFAVGQIEFAIDELILVAPGAPGPMSMAASANTELDGEDVNADATVSATVRELPQLGDMTLDLDLAIEGADAATMGRLEQVVNSLDPSAQQDPMAMYAAVEDDLKQLFASGFAVNFNRFDITVPQGTVTSKLLFSFGEEDVATFEWTSLLLSTEATIDVAIPEAIVEMITATNPQAAMAIGGGYLVKEGDAYVLKAEMKKGLLTVNGAPIPIPLGVF
ncbi:MAG: DUF945 family protein [Woeseiaceae bacterium]|nr:DUF945 family protein [Woeseiaceae bacterium]